MTVKHSPKPQGCTNYKIRQLMRQVAQHYDLEIGKAGLKGTQYALMSHLVELGPVRPGELARVMRMDASTLTRNLKPLEDAGWLQVEAGADGRSRRVSLTPAGKAKRDEAKRHWKTAQQRINNTLGSERVQALHNLIDDALVLLADQAPGAEGR